MKYNEEYSSVKGLINIKYPKEIGFSTEFYMAHYPNGNIIRSRTLLLNYSSKVIFNI